MTSDVETTTLGLLVVASSVLFTGVLALLIGYDTAAEHGGAAIPATPARAVA
jgi:hypothetical protein